MIKKPLVSSEFKSLLAEFHAIREDAEKPGSANHDFSLVAKIYDCVERLEELIRMDSKPQEMLRCIIRNIEDRKTQHDYLEKVSQGLSNIHKAMRKHQKSVADAEWRLGKALTFSLTLKPNEKLGQIAEECQKELRFDAANKVITKTSEFGRSQEQIQDLSYWPCVSHKLPLLLRRKAVLQDGTQKWLLDLQSDVRLTFLVRDGGVAITVLLKRKGVESIVRVINLSEETLRDLRKQDIDDTELMPPDKPLLKFASSQLCDIVSDAAAGRQW